jgi:hypothetical protein
MIAPARLGIWTMAIWMASALSGAAFADVIYSPTVEEGEKAIEWRSTVHSDGAEEHKLELEYSPTAWWRAEWLATVDRDPASPRQVSEVSFENVFSLNPQGRDFLDLGVLAELSKALRGEQGWAAEIGLLAEHPTSRTVTTVNVAAERELLPGSSTELTVSARFRWRLGPRFEPGVEYHADLGEIEHVGAWQTQRHSIGPALVGRWPLGHGAMRYEAAWVFGLTTGSPSHSARLQLEWEFH